MAVSAKPPLLERVGAKALVKWSTGAVAAPQPVHLLDERERQAVLGIERATIARAALAGAVSALAAAIAESIVKPHEDVDPIYFYAVVLGVTVVASIAEIAFLSWDSLRAAHRIANAAGVSLDDREIVHVLARAALEVANPIESDLGINPLRETPKWRLLLAAVAYKLKVSATNIVLKQVIRRAMGRAAVRTWLQYIAVPVTALWNAIVCAIVLREVRVRVFGPSLADDIVARLLPADVNISDALADALARAVGTAVVKSADLHPNLERLLRAVLHRTQSARPVELDEVPRFLSSLEILMPDERALALRMFRAAIVMDGRITRRERALARALDVDRELDEERRRVLKGEPLALG